VHSSYLQLGRLYIPIFGIFAALGLMSALALSQRTARFAGVDPDAVWNAQMTAVISAFVISRLLLIAFNLHSFLEYPLLMISLPSLTSAGVLLTSLFMLFYLRWRRLALLAFLDAVAPCATLLWAFVNLGRIAQGTRDGMPTHLPWGIRDAQLGRVHPVETYTVVVAAALCIWLYLLLKQNGSRTGRTFAFALVFVSVAIFFLDFFRLPSDLLAHSWLDPAQIIAVAMVFAGGVLLLRAPAPSQTAPSNERANAV
jgi:phosphatidylglycerol:prolipoprotein diacylglycerol transferase